MKYRYKNKSIKIYVTFILILSSFWGFAQTQSNVTTPKGSPVTAYIMPEESSSIRASRDNYYDSLYPNATQIETYDGYSSTNRFNCHAYAWYMSENNPFLNNPRYIGEFHYDEDVYMTDGSYIQVANEMYPGKVSWPSSDDHSAVTTSQSGVFISKWGRQPLMRHDWDDQGYGTTGLKYYVSTDISGGMGVLCNNSSRNFSARNIPNATYDWSVGSGLTLNSDGNYSTSVTASSSYIGQTWIEVEITSPFGVGYQDVKTSKRINFWIGKPAARIVGLTEVAPYSSTTYTALPYFNCPISSYLWSISSSDYAFFYNSNTMQSFEIETRGKLGTFYLYLTTSNACGSQNLSKSITVTNDGGGGVPRSVEMPAIIIYPNPAADYINVKVSDGIISEIQENKDLKYEIILYNSNQQIVYKKKSDDSLITIDAKNLDNGFYYLHFIYKNEIIKEQVIISK